MPNFNNSNGDSGAAEAASVQPITNGETVNDTVSNRTAHNLRLRTDVLRFDSGLHAVVTAAPVVFYADDGNATPVPVAIKWDGPYDPTTGATVPARGSVGSGVVSLGGPGSARLLLQPANSVPVTIPASLLMVSSGGLNLTFQSDMAAAEGGNWLRVRLFSVAGGGDLGIGIKAVITWTHPLAEVGKPATDARVSTQLPTIHVPVSVPGIQAASVSTCNIQIRNDGTTTIGDIKTALLHSYPASYISILHAPGILQAPTDGPGVILTSDAVDGTAVPALFDGANHDMGYATLYGGLDAVQWVVPGSTLNSFFDSGLVNTTLSAAVVATGVQTKQVGSTTNISVGSVLDIDTSTNYEAVTVTAVDGIGSTITANFTKTHLISSPVKARPNGIRKGDVYALTFGAGASAKRRLEKTTLTTGDMGILRNGGVPQESPVIPVAVCPPGMTRVLLNGQYNVEQAGQWTFNSMVQLAGDLLGPSSTASVPKVVLASNVAPGLVTLAGDLAGAGTTSATPKVVVANTVANGIVKLNNVPGSATLPQVVSIMANGQAEVTATGGDSYAIKGTGVGAGDGIQGISGNSVSGIGLHGFGGAGNTSAGVYGEAAGGNAMGGYFAGAYGLKAVSLIGGSPRCAGEFTAASSSDTAIRAAVGLADLPKIDRVGTIDIGTVSGTTITIGRTGQTVVHGDNTTVPTTSDFQYASALTRHAHSFAYDWTHDINLIVLGTGNRSRWLSDNTASAGEALARVMLPKGATITALHLLSQNGRAVPVNTTVYATLKTFNTLATDYTTTAIENGGVGFVVTNGALDPSPLWSPVTIAGAPVMPEDGALMITLITPSGGGSNLVLYIALRVTYTMTSLRPVT